MANSLSDIFHQVTNGLRKIDVLTLDEREEMEKLMQKAFDKFKIKTGGRIVFKKST